tara:strand:+ start:556 stop:672 length:117 start_codon:yes stop_codon:yes gene_type:complete
MDKDYTDLMKIILFVALFFFCFMVMACDSGWSVAGYEI